jgi:HNH endonuclease
LNLSNEFHLIGINGRKLKPIEFIVNENGCFICTSHAKDWDGYPLLKRNGKMIRMSRYIYEECFGPIKEGNVIRHKCDNPECINPEHLEQGTPHENSLDMVRRNRSTRGERNGAAKLTEKEVKDIRNLRNMGIPYEVIRNKYGISKTTIWEIVKKRKWKHVD